ncbi:hypothetical protein [Paraburkholderia strydomiana]|uniref:hypothetical protein n=1 Tax=Paraburkholderia strydomiana TaxID=1245417 RepID=UPI0038BA1EE5
MRKITVALVSAAAALPLLAHAATTAPDPTDAGASVPPPAVSSAFDGYKAWQDGEAPSWQQLNRAVAPSRGMTGMQHGQKLGAASAGESGSGHGGDSK